ncbi:MAG: 6-carboxytetrahydropterin synthase [Azospirillaceae bacterium]|nr:6-carboxytetrahydropterin synthase [Azospirillaceae bacterium]
MFSLEFTRRFAMAHRFLGDDAGKCAVPHGHNEEVTVRLVPAAPARLDGSTNMVEPFDRAKRLWHRWIDEHVDHAFQLSERDPMIAWFRDFEPLRLDRLLITPGDPTTEVLACCFMAKITAFLALDGGRLHCTMIRIAETPTNALCFDGDPADWLPAESAPAMAPPWWRRADMAINDLVPRGAPAVVASR